jgi:hypothetical protein
MKTSTESTYTVGRHLRRVALVVSTSVCAWTHAADLRVADGNVVLALSETGDAVPAVEVSTRAGLPVEAVYPALHRLTDRGYVLEEHRRHRLTAAGQRLVADFDRFSVARSIPQTKGTS